MSIKTVFTIESVLVYVLGALVILALVASHIPPLLGVFLIFFLGGMSGYLAYRYPINVVYGKLKNVISPKGGDSQ
jgi:hypothetical protein